MKKRFISLTLALAMVLSLIGIVNVGAASSGECGAEGSNLTWSFNSGTLTISGSGDMADYDYTNEAPWDSEKNISKPSLSKTALRA